MLYTLHTVTAFNSATYCLR